MPELPDVPYQLPALQGRPEWMSLDWVAWFRLLRQKLADLTSATAPQTYTDVAYNGANFTGNGAMTWTVGSGDVTTLQYHKDGTKMTVSFYLALTSVGGVLDTSLQIPIPGGFTAAKTELFPILVNDAGGGNALGFAAVVAGSPTIQFRKLSGNWSTATDTTSVFGQLTLRTTA